MRYPPCGALLALLAVLIAGCGTIPPAAGEFVPPPAVSPDSLAALAADRDYPALERATRHDASAVALAYRAVALHRLGREAEAERTAAAALAASPPDTLASRVVALRVQNAARASDYEAALRLTDAALAAGGLDSARVAALTNERRLWAALAGVLPPEADAAPGARASLRRDAIGLRRVALRVAGDSVHYVLDTGANLGVLIRSEAERLGLAIRPSGVLVGSVTGARVPADVAVAPVEVAGITLPAVPFLVFPDSALAFPQLDYQIEGILGLPELRALGAFRLPAGEGALEILAPAAPADPPTLFLDGFTLEARVTLAFGSYARDVTCVLDTGATETHLLRPFYQRHRAAVEAAGVEGARGVGGAGGMARLAVWVLPEVKVTVGDETVRLTDVTVDAEGPEGGAPCRLGLDVLDAYGGAIFDFGAGRFLLDD
jgi:predicted aspartyl protease